SVSYTKTTEEEAWVFVAGTRGMAMYRNGVRLGGTSTAVTRSAIAIEQFRLNGGASAADGTGDVQAIALVLVLEQEWTPTQAREWSTAPFSIFGYPPLRRRVPVPAAAGTNNGAALYHHFRNLGVY
ncbi:MAG TPA: hypothetical protein VLA89_08155, partial [Gemmatimonadales bacterium]|nr:hypothetical protein [Gemmatimonadales bacterium]